MKLGLCVLVIHHAIHSDLGGLSSKMSTWRLKMGSHFPGVRVARSLRSKGAGAKKAGVQKVNNTDRVMRKRFLAAAMSGKL